MLINGKGSHWYFPWHPRLWFGYLCHHMHWHSPWYRIFDPLNNCVVIGVARNVEVFNLPVLDQLLKFLQGNCVIGPVIAPDRHHGLTGLDNVRGGRIGIGGGKQVGC